MKEHPILFTGEMVRAILDGSKNQTRRLLPKRVRENIFWLAGAGDDRDDPANWGWQYDDGSGTWGVLARGHSLYEGTGDVSIPLGPEVGDRLWVRETWARMRDDRDECDHCGRCSTCTNYRVFEVDGEQRLVEYKADTGNKYPGEWPDDMGDEDGCGRWKPNIHMPRWASRITLEVTNVRVERLQDISEEDAKAEGVTLGECVYRSQCNSSRCPGHHHKAAFAKLWDDTYGNQAPWSSNPWVVAYTFRMVKP